jgi:hypothetical protein
MAVTWITYDRDDDDTSGDNEGEGDNFKGHNARLELNNIVEEDENKDEDGKVTIENEQTMKYEGSRTYSFNDDGNKKDDDVGAEKQWKQCQS